MNNEEKILGMLETLTTDMTVVKTNITKIEGRLDNVEVTLAETNDNVRKLGQAVTVLEHGHAKMTGVLMDGFTNNTERLTRIEDKVTYYDEVLLRRVNKSGVKKAVK